MRALVIPVVAVVFSGAAWAQDRPPGPSDVGVVIDRGLGFLARDATAWKREHGCVSCHHAALVVWSMREAKERGHVVDEPVLADMTRWIAESGDGKTSLPRPAQAPKALNTKALYFALALGADPALDAASRNGLKLVQATVEGDQAEDGSWAAWPETRPPMFGGSDETMTALATLALSPTAAAGDATAKAARDKGAAWLSKTKTGDDPQSIALRLILWSRLGRPADEAKPLLRRIVERQNPDGGWSQAGDLPSDAWATGQALYALSDAGLKGDDPIISRAHAFLIKTQRDDGSWPMTSRPTKPGGPGSKNLTPITGAGGAWAVLGLVRSR